jgi:hypothetical protein
MSLYRITSLHSLAIAIRDLESLLVLNKPPLKRPSNPSLTKKNSGKNKEKEKEKDPYNRDQYWSYVSDPKDSFLKLYGFCFALAKPPCVTLFFVEFITDYAPLVPADKRGISIWKWVYS